MVKANKMVKASKIEELDKKQEIPPDLETKVATTDPFFNK